VNRILRKEQLSRDVFLMDLDAPAIAKSRKAGQFVILMIDSDYGERIPLTIADADAATGRVTIIFQAVGGTTRRLAELGEGQSLAHVLGPLGRPTEIRKHDAPVVCVGGGIGVAPLHPIVQAFKKAGNTVITIIGARNKDLLIMEKEMAAYSDRLIVCTDDGSYGRKALVTEPLKEFCEGAAGAVPAEAVAIGPPVMMKFCAATTRPYGVHTIVSLNSIMVDGTGMCGGCRVAVGGKTRFVCVDGPEFDGHQVDFDSLVRRLSSYKDIEARKIDHACNLTEAARTLAAGRAS
jgi:ferredoxin--NADP+ reductase